MDKGNKMAEMALSDHIKAQNQRILDYVEKKTPRGVGKLTLYIDDDRIDILRKKAESHGLSISAFVRLWISSLDSASPSGDLYKNMMSE